MKLDNLNNFSAEKLQQIIEQRWGQRVELSSLSEDSLDLFKTSVQESIRSFESSMSFNQNSFNSKYMENKVLLDYIIKEQEKRMTVSKVSGNEVELTDPQNPGIKTTIDTSKVDVDKDSTGQMKIDQKKKDQFSQTKLNPGQTVKMEDMDDDVKSFMDYLDSKGYKVISQGGSANSVSIEYQDREGNSHTVDFKRSGVTEQEGDLEDVVAPEFKKLVHDMQQGMSKDELEKKYPKQKDSIEQLAKDLAAVAESMTMAIKGQLIEAYQLSGREASALRLLVGSQNFTMARRALEMAKRGQSVPASLMKGFMPVIEKLDTFIKGGTGAVQRLKSLEKIVGTNETYEAKLKKLLENEMETSEILLASQDIVDQITDMYEKIAELKSSAVLELVDRMANEMGQETADSFSNQINPTLETLEDALGTARKGAQDSVAIVKGEKPQPMADTGSDMDTDIETDVDSDIEGGDEFSASEPASGGNEPSGRAER